MNEEPEARTEGAGADQPSQEELRRRIDEQLRNVRVEDLMVESVVSVLNLTARRIAKEDERDLDQARVGIEAVRAWVDILPGDAAGPVRNALSELQVLYAREAEKGPGAEDAAEKAEGAEAQAKGGGAEGQEPPQPPQPPQPPRPGESPPRLWTPPGSN